MRRINAAIKFISFEQLPAPINNLDLNGIGRVIVGGESRPGVRAIKESWIIDNKVQTSSSFSNE